MQRIIWIVSALLVGLPSASLAERLSYNYFEAQYIESDLDGGFEGIEESADGSGYGIEVSGELSETWHLFGRFADTEPEFSGRRNGEIELQRISAGVGVNSVSDEFSIFGRLTYEDVNAEVDDDSGNGGTVANDNGYGLTLGGRWALNKFLELDLSAKFIDIDEVFDNDVGFSAGLLFDISERWALRARLEKIQDFEELLFGVRAYF